MKYQNYSTNRSKAARVYDLFLDNPDALFNSNDIRDRFNSIFEDGIKINRTTVILTRLYSQHKILRTDTQTTVGYLYSLQNQQKLNKKYIQYLLPYNFENKRELISLMLQNSFDNLNINYKIKDIKQFRFFKKYGKVHFTKRPIKSFLAKLVAFVMGDGHIKIRKDSIMFFFKEKSDAELFKKDFIQYFKKESIKVIKREYCYACIISSRYLIELLEELGAPVGNKVLQSFEIPDWIFHGPNYIKLSFLSVIYGNEGSKPQDNRWRIQFVVSKNRDNVKSLLIFENQIRAMLNHFEISTSFIQLRNQRRRQFHGRFYIKRKENLHKFYKFLEFSYASEKQKVLESLILKGNSFGV